MRPKGLWMTAYVTLPGINGSGPQHWQSLWERADPAFVRFQPADWDHPYLTEWSSALDRAVAAAAAAPILVAHSLACLLVAHWGARAGARQVAGAFLVSLPDPKGRAFPSVAAPSFAEAELPDGPMPFPTWILMSSDDPYGTVDHARHRSSRWGTSLVLVGHHGHLNEASRLGPWPVGASLLQAFTAGLDHGLPGLDR